MKNIPWLWLSWNIYIPVVNICEYKKYPKMKFIHGILLNIPYIYPMVSIIYLNIHGIKISHGRWRPPTPAPPWGEEMSRKVIKRQFTKEATNLKKRLSEVFLRYNYKIQNIRYIRYNYTYVSYNLFGGCKIQLSYLYIYIHMVRPPPSSKDTAELDNLPKTKRYY